MRNARSVEPPRRDDGARTAAEARSPRERARAYLDLWERNLGHLSVHGPVLRPPGGGSAPPQD